LLERQATRYPVLLTLFRRTNGIIIVSLRSRNGEALKVAEKLQGGGHANACGASLPKAVRTIPDAVTYLRNALNPTATHQTALNSLENVFAELEAKQG
jgi:nanoRNase/pAp phosphatase (c-di-AMP/oligoRNAs hydrolase)